MVITSTILFGVLSAAAGILVGSLLPNLLFFMATSFKGDKHGQQIILKRLRKAAVEADDFERDAYRLFYYVIKEPDTKRVENLDSLMKELGYLNTQTVNSAKERVYEKGDISVQMEVS